MLACAGACKLLGDFELLCAEVMVRDESGEVAGL